MKKWLTVIVIGILFITAVLVGLNFASPNIRQSGDSDTTQELTQNIAKQMFPDSKFSSNDGVIYFSTQIPANYQTLYLDKILRGSFVDSPNEYFAVLKAPYDVTVHAGGFYYTVGAVFDGETGIIKSPLVHFVADEGEISILEGKEQDQVLFLGSSTYQGYTTPTGGVYNISQGYWEKTWPVEGVSLEDHYAVFGNNRLIIYKKVFDNKINSDIMPSYHFELEREMIWNPKTQTFVEPIYE